MTVSCLYICCLFDFRIDYIYDMRSFVLNRQSRLVGTASSGQQKRHGRLERLQLLAFDGQRSLQDIQRYSQFDHVAHTARVHAQAQRRDTQTPEHLRSQLDKIACLFACLLIHDISYVFLVVIFLSLSIIFCHLQPVYKKQTNKQQQQLNHSDSSKKSKILIYSV